MNGVKSQLTDYKGLTNGKWTQISATLPPCDKTKNFSMVIETRAPFSDALFAFDSLRFTDCEPQQVCGDKS